MSDEKLWPGRVRCRETACRAAVHVQNERQLFPRMWAGRLHQRSFDLGPIEAPEPKQLGIGERNSVPALLHMTDLSCGALPRLEKDFGEAIEPRCDKGHNSLGSYGEVAARKRQVNRSRCAISLQPIQPVVKTVGNGK